MAKAEKIVVEEQVIQQVTKGVKLDLTNQEAAVLRVVLGAIGGPPEGSRGIAEKIYDLLEDCGFDDEHEMVIKCMESKRDAGPPSSNRILFTEARI